MEFSEKPPQYTSYELQIIGVAVVTVKEDWKATQLRTKILQGVYEMFTLSKVAILILLHKITMLSIGYGSEYISGSADPKSNNRVKQLVGLSFFGLNWMTEFTDINPNF